MAKQRIAILGGGVGAITAAFALTSDTHWKERYDITVYQLGWRLGGKGASGRNLAKHKRIEEHGLHIWFGFYENAFRVMQACYREWTGYEKSWERAFTRHNFIVLEDYINGQWRHYPLEFPQNDDIPGQRTRLELDPWDYISMTLQWMRTLLSAPGTDEILGPQLSWLDHPEWWRRVDAVLRIPELALGLDVLGSFDKARQLVEWIGKTAVRQFRLTTYVLIALLERARHNLWTRIEPLAESNDDARRLWVAIDIGITVIRGILMDELFVRGFDAVNGEELRDWLRRHGASPLTMQSPLIRVLYETPFAFIEGDTDRPAAEAGTALRGTLRMLFTYRGAVMWKMQGGMGDVVFAPLYEVLKKRGVKFEFFHRVRRLHLTPDKRTIGAITVSRQVRLRGATYEPLVTIKGRPCWPSTPDYAQIDPRQAAALKRRGVNLESVWTDWAEPEHRLQKGRDFDLVVLGISLGALREICSELIATQPAWRSMVDRVQTIRTQGFQLWLTPTLDEMGFQLPSAVSGTYVNPLNTWADMTHTSLHEDWSHSNRPGCVLYFCGPLKKTNAPEDQEPPWHKRSDFPRVQQEKAYAYMEDLLRHHMRHPWPAATAPDNPEGLDWRLLVAPDGVEGVQRLREQFWTANVEPSSLYVLSVPNSTRYRLRSDGSGFDNLYLAGDWTKNGINAGCVESAVMSGLQASRAICGHPEHIIGESDFE